MPPSRNRRLVRLRAEEDRALAAWLRASANLNQEVVRWDQAVVRAEAAVDRAIRPLARRGYRQLEGAYAEGDLVTVARYAHQLGDVRRYLEVVRAACGKRDQILAARAIRVAAARRVRARTARPLLALPPLPSDIVGASRHQLSTLARDEPSDVGDS